MARLSLVLPTLLRVRFINYLLDWYKGSDISDRVDKAFHGFRACRFFPAYVVTLS